VRAYQARLGGPLLDRIDLHVEVPALRPGEVTAPAAPLAESSDAVRARVEAARERQRVRFRESPEIYCNSQMEIAEIETHCACPSPVRAFLDRAVESLSLSARAVHRSLRVARTIADLEEGAELYKEHVAEAIQYRWLDRQQAT
jgi:magnesium chelatase family protein